SRRRRCRCPREKGRRRRRQADEADLRRAQRRADRDPDRARRCGGRLDDAGWLIERTKRLMPAATAPSHRTPTLTADWWVIATEGVEHETLWISALAEHLEGSRRRRPPRLPARAGAGRSDQGRFACARV